MLLPHNSDIAKPRALNTLLEGLAELGVDKRLLKNKKLLSNLLRKKKSIKTMKAPKTTSNNLQTVKMKWKQLLRIVSPKRLKTMIWKQKATTRIVTLKVLQSYSKRIQICVNTVLKCLSHRGHENMSQVLLA